MIVVEGLDGTGKSTLAEHLCRKLTAHGLPSRTPPTKWSVVRNVFDRYGGLVARAFYMISNYAFVRECFAACESSGQSLTFVVDRFFSTTASYTIGKETSGGIEGTILSTGAII